MLYMFLANGDLCEEKILMKSKKSLQAKEDWKS